MSKYSLSPDVRSLKKGDRFVIDKAVKYVPGSDPVRFQEAILTYMGDKPVRDISTYSSPAGNDAFAVSEDGTRFDLAFEHSSASYPVFKTGDGVRRAVWTLPTPDVSDDEIFTFVNAFRGVGQPYGLDRTEAPHGNNGLFLVDSVDEKYIRCRMVSWAIDTLHDYESFEHSVLDDGYPVIRDEAFHFIDLKTFREAFTVEGPFALSSYEILIRNKSMPSVSPGSLLVCSDFWCRYKRDVLVTGLRLPMVAGTVGEKNLEQWLSPQQPGRDIPPERVAFTFGEAGARNIPLKAIQDHLKEIERAKAALIPSEALVLVMPADEGEDNSYPSVVNFGSRGVTFFDDTGDTDENLSHSAPVEGGLWVFTNARYWSSHDDRTGEWDGGLGGDWRPATPEDLASFDVTDVDIQAEAEEGYEGLRYEQAVKDGTFTSQMMALAAHVSDADQRRVASL